MLQSFLFGGDGWLSPRTLGAAVLITVAAVVVGYVVTKVWPKAHNPQLFGFLAAITLVGGLAYAGSTGATIAIVFVLAIGGLAAVFGVIF
jgi:hypothetical protein